jgi:hypothetical protein
MKLLPRHSFRGTGHGCAAHGEPSCLCDVIVTEVTPIRRDIKHMFHQVALDELGDDLVNERNFVEFFAIVLGCHHAWRDDPSMWDGSDGLPIVLPTSVKFLKAKGWDLLDDEMKLTMVRHFRADTPWSYAKIELEDLDLTSDELRVLEKTYRTAANSARSKKTLGQAVGAQRKPINHGSRYGAQAHRRRDENPCQACLEAETVNHQELRARKQLSPSQQNHVASIRSSNNRFFDQQNGKVSIES